MIRATLDIVESFTEGEAVNCDAAQIVIEGVSTDTRNIQPNHLFIPLIGERHNGHAFVSDAMRLGAAAFLWQADQGKPPDGAAIVVDDTLTALQRLASKYRATLPVRVIGVTGSNGKTTTKDMTAAVLSTRYRVYKTQGNLNNHIGLPLTLLSLSPETEFAVIEMGMSGRGEIRALTAFARPDAAIITNVGDAHLLQLGTRDEIAKAKLEICSGLKENGLFVVPGDEPLLERYLEEAETPDEFQLIRFGEQPGNDIRLASVTVAAELTSFQVEGSAEKFTIPMLGKHNAVNALGAIAIGRAFGITDSEIAKGLSQFEPAGMRIERVEGINGATLWNDAYNANPTSMRAALELLATAPGYNRKIAVLGDMLEMGPDEREIHRAIGRSLSSENVHYVFTFGELGREIAEGARETFENGKVEAFDTKESLTDRLAGLMNTGDIILIKASRGMKMETVVQSLRAHP